jgi:class 3 adenylate cyclase
LDIKIGINTGRIVGGIIGTKVARYDIFGKDVLIARLVQKGGIPGQVVVSESTRRMVARRNFVYDTFDW